MSTSQTIELEVKGEKISFLLSDLEVGDINEDMDRVASQMAYWANVWSHAVQEQEQADAAYRKWRAEFGERLFEEDRKMAEWRVKQAIESSPKFEQYKQAVAACMRNEAVLRSVYESFRVKASILQSKGAMMRAEQGAWGLHTPTEERRAQGESKVNALRERNNAKRTRVSVDS